jgi:hypothetical protein
MDYQKAAAMLKTARNPGAGKPLENNTRLVQRGRDIAVQLHGTDVVTFSPSGAVTLNSGGWKTVTTKARMNEWAPFQVWSDQGTWYVGAGVLDSKPRVPFADGMTIYPSGKVKGAGRADIGPREIKLRKAASEYARLFVDKLFAGEIPAPSSGDCWHCGMYTQDGKPLGEGVKDASHIIGHIKERYFVPSLAVNALKAFGASIAATQTARALMQGKPEYAFSTKREDFLAAQIQKCIRRYVLRQQGLAS